MDYILGLDLGPTSIGWAVVECDAQGIPLRLVGANSRIFLAMVEADTKVPKNKKRREKRSMRRQVKRYKERRAQLIQLLIKHGMLGSANSDPQTWEDALNQQGNPFILRTEALTRPLTLPELGRVFLHLLRRRGYKSNRGAKYQSLLDDLKRRGITVALSEENRVDDGEASDETVKETGLVLSGIRLLRAAMEEKDCGTIAQLVVKLAIETGHVDKHGIPNPRRPHTLTREELTKKGKALQYHLYASRELYEEEFIAIWDTQAKHHPELLTNELKFAIHKAIFFQEPLQSQRRSVGKCSLKLDKRRAAKALLEAQEYRLLEDLNNLEYHMPKQQGTFRLSTEERKKVLEALSDPTCVSERGQISWSETRKLIQKPKAKFNLERTSKNGLIGNRTALAIARLIPQEWTELEGDKAPGETYSGLQKALVHDLVHIENKLVLFNRLTNHYNLPPQRCPWHFSGKDAFALATLELEEGYVKHCRSVIENLLPHLRGGMIYTDALTAAGYLRRDEIAREGLSELPQPPDIANPIVQKALFETRRVVNAIIKHYSSGKPKIIRIEMAREMKASKSHRADIEKQQRANQKANDDAAEKIRELAKTYPDLGIKVSREAILKYKLMLEQGRSCVYSSPERKIVDRMLFDGTVEIDHIYPLSVSLDDSYMNKVLSFRAENHEKGQRTPWQAWRETDKYEEILKRLERLSDYPKAKLRRVKDDKFDPNADFVAAQLNDTRYICVAVRNYLATLGYDDQHLQISRGQMTAELRRLWGLSNILPRSTDAGNVPEVNTDTGEIAADKPEKDKKKDRGDHRHHAVDAIVTALVDRKVFADLMRRYRYREETAAWPDAPLEPPIAGLRGEAERIVMDRVVSYATNRKVWGGLHDELPYGPGVWIERSVPLKKLLRTPEVIRCDPDKTGKRLEDGDRWVARDEVRQILRQWLDSYERANKRKDFPLPTMPDGSELKEVDVENRCYVKRASVEDALSRVDNKPGHKTWIVDQGVRAALMEWRKTHKDKEAAIDPPRMPRADGNADKAHPIRTVRMATNASGLVRFRDRPQIFAKSSNHHVAIFKRVLPDGTMERKGVYVDMLEAARRVREQPIIRKDPAQLSALDPSINPDAWRFEMALCSQDMVLWDANDVPNDQRHLGNPVYRLQKMSGANNTLIFRHFSVTSTSDRDRRGLIQRGPETLPATIRKIRVDALGRWELIGGD